MQTGFMGFPEQLQGYLYALHFQNTPDRQAENLIGYKEYITKPLEALFFALLPVVTKIDPSLDAKPSRCLSTPYTDRRFSRDVPLKEYMYIRFKQPGKQENALGFYFDMGAEDYSYGLRIYHQNKQGMENLRDKVLFDPKPFAKALAKAQKAGFELITKPYKREHFPQIEDALVRKMLNCGGFYVGKTVPAGQIIHTPQLAEEIAQGFEAVKELYTLLL